MYIYIYIYIDIYIYTYIYIYICISINPFLEHIFSPSNRTRLRPIEVKQYLVKVKTAPVS